MKNQKKSKGIEEKRDTDESEVSENIRRVVNGGTEWAEILSAEASKGEGIGGDGESNQNAG